MVDLVGQYEKIKEEINQNIINLLQEGKFINGPIVKEFSKYSNIALINTDELVTSCLSLPIHTEIENSSQEYIIEKVLNFFK